MMIEVTIDSVRVNLMSPQRLVILREVGADRYLPIWVGPYEAEAITVALQEVEMIRPLTHDLLKNVFTTFQRQGQADRDRVAEGRYLLREYRGRGQRPGDERGFAAVGCHCTGSARARANPGARERDTERRHHAGD